MELCARDRQLLIFEKRWWHHGEHKMRAVESALGMSLTHYQRLLNAIIDHPAALHFDPVLVKGLRRKRARRT